MDPNWNVPSEREWTAEEMEEFLSSHDSGTALLGGGVMTNNYSGKLSTPITLRDMYETIAKIEQANCTGIHITSITPPEQGWPIMAHCSICKKTVIVLSPYASKPEEGDIWSLKGTCLDEDEHIRHNMYPQHDYPWPNRMGPRPEEWTAEAHRHYWNPMGVPK